MQVWFYIIAIQCWQRGSRYALPMFWQNNCSNLISINLSPSPRRMGVDNIAVVSLSLAFNRPCTLIQLIHSRQLISSSTTFENSHAKTRFVINIVSFGDKGQTKHRHFFKKKKSWKKLQKSQDICVARISRNSSSRDYLLISCLFNLSRECVKTIPCTHFFWIFWKPWQKASQQFIKRHLSWHENN